ncbi:MAG: discoidin domain-containing protein, partial [Paramuribaculum sp.]|nr:discoidin domain-containing protein [Paramuribaculum sp.]
VTVAGYPHWVDFDAGETKNIKGVRYLPRQDGNRTGNVKDYEIYVSDSTENWGEPVAKGSFKGSNLQEVQFKAPVKGRYIRFMTLNAQDGRDYASGAEFEVIAD